MLISNYVHRMMILQKINWLFPSNTVDDISSGTCYSLRSIDESSSEGYDEGQSRVGIKCSASSCRSLQSMDCSTSSRESSWCRECSTSSNEQSEFLTPSQSLGNSRMEISLQHHAAGITRSVKVVRLMRLRERRVCGRKKVIATCLRTKIVSLVPNPGEKWLAEEEQIKRFYSKFKRFGYEVEISPPDKRGGSFTVEFADVMKAQQALSQSKEIGLILTAKKLKRPGPKSPFNFEVLFPLKVRLGRTLTSDEVDEKKKGDVVLVNRIKGRRARFCTKENGSFKNVGWGSLFTREGIPLLQQLEE